MRLSEIFVNDNDLSHIVSQIKRDCAPFVEVLKQNHGRPLFRGSDTGRPEVGHMKLISPRLERKPKDTPADIHNFMNQLFVEAFGYPYRNGIFTTSSQSTAAAYGTVCVVFPIGELKFIWSKSINDLFYQIDEIYSKEAYDDVDTINQNPQLKQEFVELVNTYQSNNLADAINVRHEIIFANNCYTINLNDYQAIIGELIK